MIHRIPAMPLMILLLMFISAAASAGGTGGRLTAVSGNVWTTVPGEDEIRARVGTVLVSGTVIRTGADGKAEVEFEDGSSVVVQSNTRLRLSGIQRQKKKTSILIFFGRVWNKVSRLLGDRAAYEVNTPLVVAGVRGTEFETAVGEDGSVRIRVKDGNVEVFGDGRDVLLNPAEEVEADIEGIGRPAPAEKEIDWEQWVAVRQDRLRRNGKEIIDAMKDRVVSRKETLVSLRNQQQTLVDRREEALTRARAGDEAALEEIRQTHAELVLIADQIADIGDVAGSQFGFVAHCGTLAADPVFGMKDGAYVAAEAERLRRIRAEFDEMIAEGTEISIEAMEKTLQEMSDGQRGSLKFDKGSSAKDLWGD